MSEDGHKAICERLDPAFKFVFQGKADSGVLQVSGPMNTQDQLDAVVAGLLVMRDWLPSGGATLNNDQEG